LAMFLYVARTGATILGKNKALIATVVPLI
jgi:hypothetical protein